jgi:hypothetical protein
MFFLIAPGADRMRSLGTFRCGRWMLFHSLVLAYVCAFGFVRDADELSNVNSKDNHSQFFSIHLISTAA